MALLVSAKEEERLGETSYPLASRRSCRATAAQIHDSQGLTYKGFQHLQTSTTLFLQMETTKRGEGYKKELRERGRRS